MHNHDDNYPARLGLEHGNSRLQDQSTRMSHRGRPAFELQMLANIMPIIVVALKINHYNAQLFLFKSWRSKDFFQFEIIINVLVNSFRFI